MRDILRVNMTDLSTSWEPLPEAWAAVRRSRADRRDRLQRGPGRRRSARSGQRARVRSRHVRRHDRTQRRPSVRGRQEPADRRHQGVELRRPGSRTRSPASASPRSSSPASPPIPSARYVLTIEADRSVKLERVDAWAGLGNYEIADAIKATRPEDDRYATITNGPAGEALAQGRRHRDLRPEGLPEPLRRSRWPRRRHGQQGPQGHRRLRQGREASSSTPTRTRSSPPRSGSPRRSRSTASPAPACRCTAPTCSPTS